MRKGTINDKMPAKAAKSGLPRSGHFVRIPTSGVEPNQQYVDALFVAIAMFEGIFARVAEKVGVHPSFVSRVASGKRTSEKVSAAINYELNLIRIYLNDAHARTVQ